MKMILRLFAFFGKEIHEVRRQPRVIRASADKPRMSCMIGERLWQERWGGYEWR